MARPELASASVHDHAGDRAVYRPRRPTATSLYPIVQHHPETFLAHAAEADPLGDGVSYWVENDFRAYLSRAIYHFLRTAAASVARHLTVRNVSRYTSV